jgi:hypothetical protein
VTDAQDAHHHDHPHRSSLSRRSLIAAAGGHPANDYGVAYASPFWLVP